MWGDALPASYDDDRMREPDYDEEPYDERFDDERYNADWDIYGNEVEEASACPLCGNREADYLEIHDFDNSLTVHCACGLWYKLED